MHCRQCGHENPYGNFFCGRCGSPLLRKDTSVPKPPEQVDASATQASSEAIAGPSFLGLAGEPANESRSLEYLYDDEPQHRYGRLIIALLILVGFGVFIAYQWKQRPDWYKAFTGGADKPKPQPSVEIASAQEPPLPAAPSAALPADAQPASPAPASPAEDAGAPHSTEPSPVPQAEPNQPPRAEHTEVKTSAASGEESGEKEVAPPRPASPPDESAALFTRGLAYLYGNGVPRSCSQALVYITSAARRGNAKANSQLGGLYATGHCVPLDRAKAYQYFTRASNAGRSRNVYIEHNREMLWSQMSDAEKAQVRQAQ